MSGWYKLGLEFLHEEMAMWDEWLFVQLYHDEICEPEWEIFV